MTVLNLPLRFERTDKRQMEIYKKLGELSDLNLHSRDDEAKLAVEERWERFANIVKLKIAQKYAEKITAKSKKTGKSFETIAVEYLEKGARMDADFAIDF